MSEISTAGHGPSRGYGHMNDHLKRYFRAHGDNKQRRMDAAFTRTGPLGKTNHVAALRQRPGHAIPAKAASLIREVRRRRRAGEKVKDIAAHFGMSQSWVNGVVFGTLYKSVK